MTTGKKIGTVAAIAGTLLVIGLIYYNYFFVFGEGVKAGELNYIVKKDIFSKRMREN